MMIEVYFPPSVPYHEYYIMGSIGYRHVDNKNYLGIGQQLFAQTMGWA